MQRFTEQLPGYKSCSNVESKTQFNNAKNKTNYILLLEIEIYKLPFFRVFALNKSKVILSAGVIISYHRSLT